MSELMTVRALVILESHLNTDNAGPSAPAVHYSQNSQQRWTVGAMWQFSVRPRTHQGHQFGTRKSASEVELGDVRMALSAFSCDSEATIFVCPVAAN
jgi:hypothetical protein